jgi:hypothetical protein
MTKHKRRGPKPEDGVPRVRLGHKRGPFVAKATELCIEAWRSTYGLPLGRIIDQLVRHAHLHPGFKLEVKQPKPRAQ